MFFTGSLANNCSRMHGRVRYFGPSHLQSYHQLKHPHNNSTLTLARHNICLEQKKHFTWSWINGLNVYCTRNIKPILKDAIWRILQLLDLWSYKEKSDFLTWSNSYQTVAIWHGQISTQQKKFTRQVKILAKICDGFPDIIPLCMYPQCLQTKDPLITYTGAKRSHGRMQEFAKVLEYFITDTNSTGGDR